jgi:hypothetical protein
MQAYVEDPLIDDVVKPEDQALVKDVITVLSALQHPNNICKKWSVMLKPVKVTQYEVSGMIDTKSGTWQVSYADLDMIRQLNYARIGPVVVKGTGTAVEISVTVTSTTERAMVTECDIIRVHKRAKWFHGGSAT